MSSHTSHILSGAENILTAVLLVSLLCALHPPELHAADEVHLIASQFPPYLLEKNGSLAGIGLERVQQVLKLAGVSFSIVMVSGQERAIDETRSGNADGYFLAAKDSSNSTFSVMSEPVIVHRWSWFLPADSTYNPAKASFKPYARVGTLQYSSTYAWLKENGYRISGIPSSADALIIQLNRGSVNSVLVTEFLFLKALKDAGDSPGRFKRVVQFETPLSICISKVFLAANPGTMEKINAAIQKTAADETR